MSLTLKLDENNDLSLDASNSLSLLSGIEAVEQNCNNYAKSVLGEMVYQTDKGVDYSSVFDVLNLSQYRQSLYENILRVDGVIKVQSLSIEIIDDTVEYSATIITQYGIGNITDAVNS